MGSEKVRTELDGGVLTITLADPDNRNALGRQLSRELLAAIDRADADDAVRVVVLTNDGSTFCAGADLSERSDDARDDEHDAVDPVGFFGRIRHSPKPWVGRIAGHAVAGGLGLAAATDISVAVDSAKMGFTEVRIGVAPAIIAVLCLPKMRRAEVSEAFLRGNRFLAPEAARLGIINHAVPAEELDATVDEIVDDLVLGGPGALAACKQIINRLPDLEFVEALLWASEVSANLFETPEGQEGMKAYLEKRSPSWVPD